jgi:hypothetical protein
MDRTGTPARRLTIAEFRDAIDAIGPLQRAHCFGDMCAALLRDGTKPGELIAVLMEQAVQADVESVCPWERPGCERPMGKAKPNSIVAQLACSSCAARIDPLPGLPADPAHADPAFDFSIPATAPLDVPPDALVERSGGSCHVIDEDDFIDDPSRKWKAPLLVRGFRHVAPQGGIA